MSNQFNSKLQSKDFSILEEFLLSVEQSLFTKNDFIESLHHFSLENIKTPTFKILSGQFKGFPHQDYIALWLLGLYAEFDLTFRKSITTLDLFLSKLTSLPESFQYLTELRSLNLSANQLETFPIILCSLEHLEELDLSDNRFQSLPESISSLKNLRILALDENEFTKFPEEIYTLTNLQVLYLGANDFLQLPRGISKLSNLRELHLQAGSLMRLPEDIGKLFFLKTLDVSENQLSYVPESMAELNGKIDLSYNEIDDYPGFLWHSIGAGQVKIAGNPFAEEAAYAHGWKVWDD